MSIESHMHAVQIRSTLSADRYGTKASAKTDATLLSTPGDFSALMNSFSENTSAIETVVPKSTIQTDVPLPLRTSNPIYTPLSKLGKGSETSQNEGDLLPTLKTGGRGGFAAYAQTHQLEPNPVSNNGVDISDSTDVSVKADALPASAVSDFSVLTNLPPEDTSVIDTALPDDTVGITHATDVSVQMGTATVLTVLSAPENRFKPVAMSHAIAETAESSHKSLPTHTIPSDNLAGMASGMLSVGDSAMPPNKHTPATQSGVSFEQTLHDTRKSDVASAGSDFSVLTNLPPEDTSVIDTALPDDTLGVGITNATNASVQMGTATVLFAPENRFKPVAMSHATAETAESSPPSLPTHTIPSDNLAGMASGMLSVGDSAMSPNKHTPATQSGVSFAQSLHDTRKSDVKTWSLPLADTFVQTAGMPEVLAGMGDRLAFKSSSKTETGLEGAFVSYFGLTDSLNIDQQVTATLATVPDTAVAETVTYWATQGVQSAELKLDGFGDKPVEVSISMQGDQAQIEFRSDQPEVRLALENATTQLRDLLADQGLQLAGVSIGGSGRDSAHTHTPRQRTDGKKAVFVKTVATPVAAPGMRHVSVGRSLDVFA